MITYTGRYVIPVNFLRTRPHSHEIRVSTHKDALEQPAPLAHNGHVTILQPEGLEGTPKQQVAPANE